MPIIKLKSFSVKGFKSIKSIENFEAKNLNVLIGPNGTGKSNFIAFFQFLSGMVNSDGKLQVHLASLGGAQDVLHDGADITHSLEAELEIEAPTGVNGYRFSFDICKPRSVGF